MGLSQLHLTEYWRNEKVVTIQQMKQEEMEMINGRNYIFAKNIQEPWCTDRFEYFHKITKWLFSYVVQLSRHNFFLRESCKNVYFNRFSTFLFFFNLDIFRMGNLFFKKLWIKALMIRSGSRSLMCYNIPVHKYATFFFYFGKEHRELVWKLSFIAYKLK